MHTGALQECADSTRAELRRDAFVNHIPVRDSTPNNPPTGVATHANSRKHTMHTREIGTNNEICVLILDATGNHYAHA